MEDFFKQFRENWGQRPAPHFEENDWRSLQSRLDGERKKRPLAFAWWWLALPLLFLLTASNLLFFRELRFAEQKIAALETQHDTVFVERVVFRTDTIFQTRTLREAVVEYLPARYVAQPAIDLAGIGRPALVPSEKIASSPILDEKNPPLASGEAPTFSPVSLEKIRCLDPALLDMTPPNLPETTVRPFVFEKKKTLRQRLYPLRPTDFSLAANGGWLQPLGSSVVKGTGYSLGMEGRVGFGRRLALWLDANYTSATVEVDKMDESLGFPTIPPPSDEFSFVGAEAKQRTWQYAAGMQFAPLNRKGWKLWTGVGYGTVQVLPLNATYDFQNALPLEWKVEGDRLGLGRLDGYLLLRLGVERKLTDRLHWQLTADWRTRPGAEGLRPADLLGLRAGVGYRF
jgi:hypothetical protein